MHPSKTLRYSMFGLLYFVQGTIMAYFIALNPIYLRSFQLSMSDVGVIGLIAMIPFVIKIFFGMLSDRFNFFRLGHRKPYIIIGLLVQTICLLIVPTVQPDTQFWLFALLAFILMAGMALYDTCTDGLALDTTPVQEEGTIQSFMVGGRALGVVIISIILGLLVQQISWQVMFWAMAGMTLIPIPLVLMAKEADRPAGRKFEWKAFKAFGNRSIIALGILGALYSLITNGANEVVSPFLNEEFGVSEFGIGLYVSVWGIGVILGGLLGGRLVDRVGQRRAVQLALGLALLAILALAAINNPAIAWALMALFGLAFGFYETVYFAISMNVSDPRIAASMFSILMAVANIGTGIGLAVTGLLVDNLGFQATFAVIAALNILALPLLPVIFGSRKMVKEAAS